VIRALRPFRRPRLWLRAWFAMLALTVVVCLLPAPMPLDIEHGDKLEHFVGYALLAAYAGMLFEAAYARRLAYVAVLALGVLIEGLQTFVPWRSGGDVADMAANALGVALGTGVAITPLRHVLQWFDSRFSPAP
jgi:VanZ family protein